MSLEDNILDPGLAAEGAQQMEWARPFMPVLAEAQASAKESGALVGRRVGISLTLDATTGSLAQALADAGASVSVHSTAAYTIDAVAAALTVRDIPVYARSDADAALDSILLDRFVDGRIELLVDDGAHVTRHIHAKRTDALQDLAGVAEETTSGVRPLRVMADEGALKVPCIAVNDAKTKQLFDNVYGTGQSVVMTLLDVTNLQMQGKTCVIVGYGCVGQGIARMAHALGARIVVTEVDPVRALQAIHDGHRVAKLESVCPSGDIFITATGIGYSLTGDHIRRMKDGAVISVGGAGPPEIDLGGENPLQAAGLARAAVRTIPIGDERSVFLIADGECSNVAVGEGNPIEIMDLSLAVQLYAIAYLAEHSGTLTNDVHAVPAEIDDRVARSALRAIGAELDIPSPAQIRHAASW